MKILSPDLKKQGGNLKRTVNMKFKIVKKYIDKFYVDASDYSNHYKKIAEQYNYPVTPVQWSTENEPHGYLIGNDIPVFQIWYLDLFSPRGIRWIQYEWSEFHDRAYDDCVLTIEDAEQKCKECKEKKFNGEIVKELEL